MFLQKRKNSRVSGYLFIASGCLFLFGAFLGKQIAFIGVGAMLIATGVVHLTIAKKA
jgi:uncharacterized membrane protein HdeD (DUF308 family)